METTPERRLIGVAIGGPSNSEALTALRAVTSHADIVELRLDLFEEQPDLQSLLSAAERPVIATCRPPDEGGRFRGPENERLEWLRLAARLGAAFVDVEATAAKSLGDVRPARRIVSMHDLEGMPDLAAHWRTIRGLGADVVKVVGTARDAHHVPPVLRVLADADIPTIAMAMGAAGLASRVLALRSDACFLTYAGPDEGQGTAPGQPSIKTLISSYRARAISHATEAYGFIATNASTEDVAGYNRSFDNRGIDAVCVPLPIHDAPDRLISTLARFNFGGYHVHAPFQEAVARAVVAIEAKAGQLGKVNAMVRQGNGYLGCWVESPEEQLELWTQGGRTNAPPSAPSAT